MSNDERVWKLLRQGGLTEEGTAALMGNLYAESALRSNNLQNVYENRLGMTDEEYTDRVDSGDYTNFVSDRAGYGLAQWTKQSRKMKLLTYVRERGGSIGDLNLQVEYLLKELKDDFPGIWKMLTGGEKTMSEMSNAVLKDFENPTNQGEAVQAKRLKYASGFYDTHKGTDWKTKDGDDVKINDMVKVPRELLEQLMKYL